MNNNIENSVEFREKEFKHCLELYEDCFSEEEFLRIYNLEVTDREQYFKAVKNFTDLQECGYKHCFVAYRQLLRAKGLLKD